MPALTRRSLSLRKKIRAWWLATFIRLPAACIKNNVRQTKLWDSKLIHILWVLSHSISLPKPILWATAQILTNESDFALGVVDTITIVPFSAECKNAKMHPEVPFMGHLLDALYRSQKKRTWMDCIGKVNHNKTSQLSVDLSIKVETIQCLNTI